MLSDQQISIMCNIAASGGAGVHPDHKADLVQLVAAGYVERDPGISGLCKLTGKGQRKLDERGVGANEA